MSGKASKPKASSAAAGAAAPAPAPAAAKKAAGGGRGKVPAAAPAKVAAKPAENPLFPRRPKNLRVGGAVRTGGRDLTRFVKWPRYVRIQRQRRVLYERLKVPPAINLFRSPLDKAESFPLFSLLAKYSPEGKAAKEARIEKLAAEKAAGGTGVAPPPPAVLKFGLNHITTLIENKKAKLVVIASDVSPVELVVWLPALCRKFGVPYAVVNNKGRLGALVHMKTATALALTAYKKEDEAAFGKIVDLANAKFKDNADVRRKWGGGIMGMKTQKRLEIRERLLQAELQKKLLL